MAVYEPFDYKDKNKSKEDRFIKHAPVIDLTLEEMNNSMWLDDGTDDFLERLTVSSLLAHKGAKTTGAEGLGQKTITR
jgi:hypothetical protein